MNSQDILRAINNSGYLVEQEISGEFQKHGYRIVPNKAFQDQDEDISREYDVLATKNSGIIDQNLMVLYSLVVEIKKRKNPLVFFQRRSDTSQDIFQNTLYCSTMEQTFFRHDEFLESKKRIVTKNSNHQMDIVGVCNQFCEISGKNKAEHSHLYNSLFIPLIKGAYDSHTENQRWVVRYSQKDPMFGVCITVPLLVVDSDLFLYELETSELVKLDYAVYKRDYRSSTINHTFYIDVVTKSYLNEYLSKTNGGYIQLKKQLMENKEFLFQRCDHIIANPR